MPKAKESTSSGRGKAKTKDPNAPKRPLSAYFLFSQDERPKIKKANPSMSITEVAKELGKLWSQASAETKAKYNTKAKKDKERYDKDKAAYDKSSSTTTAASKKAAVSKKAAKKVEEEDEDDDDEEDDDEGDEDDYESD